MKNRVWLGTLGVLALTVTAPACLAVLDWNFEGAPGTGGTGGEAGKTMSTVTGSSTGSGGSSNVSGSSSSGAGGAGGGVVTCPACTYGLRVGDDQEQTLIEMGLANDGTLFFAGSHNGRVELDAANFVNDTVAGSMPFEGMQPFLAKLDRTGNPQWITQPLDWKNVEGSTADISIANNTLAWLGSVYNNGSRDTFLELRDVTGGRDVTKLRKLYGSTSDDPLRSVALSPDGQTVYIAGAVQGQSAAGAFAGCTMVPAFDTGSNDNLLVLAINVTTGTCLWGRTWGGGHHLGGTISIVTGSDGSPFVSGHISSGTITNNQGFSFPAIPPIAGMAKYGAVGFVVKLDKANGNFVAAKGYANGGLLSMAADNSTGTIMAGGAGMGNISFLGMGTSTAPDITDGADNLILAFDENLNEKWIWMSGGPKNQFCPQIHANGAGRLYAACITNQSLDRGVNINCTDSKLDPACSVLIPIQSATGTTMTAEIKSVAIDPFKTSGKTFAAAATPTALALGGSFISFVQFWDGKMLNPTGSTTDYDVAVGKVEPLP